MVLSIMSSSVVKSYVSGREGEKETGREVSEGQREKGKVCEGGKQTRRKLISMRQPRTGPVEAVRPDQSHFNGNVGRASSHVSAWK